MAFGCLANYHICFSDPADIYEGHPENKERFAIPRYSFIIIIQKLNIQFLAHIFVYSSIKSPLTLRHLSCLGTSLCIPYSYHVAASLFNQHPSGHHDLRSVYQQGAPSVLETGKSPTVPGRNCTEDARIYPNGIVHAAKLVSAGQYADVHCRATEQFH